MAPKRKTRSSTQHHQQPNPTITSQTSSTSISSSQLSSNDMQQTEPAQSLTEAAEPEARRRMREIAESRAAHFARADENDTLVKRRRGTAAASTPMPSIRRHSSNAGSEQEQPSWPGPWATARELVNKREDAQRSRQERIDIAPGEVKDKEFMDDYERAAAELTWTPTGNGKGRRGGAHISTLSNMCTQFLVKNIEFVENLGGVSTDVRTKIASELAAKRLLVKDNLKRIIAPNMTELVLQDCSGIDEETLIEILEEITQIEDRTSSDLGSLKLSNAGRCFGDRAAACLMNRCSNIVSLSLGGLYRLSDAALTKLVKTCTKLQAVCMECNNRLTKEGIEAVCTLSELRCLSLDKCVQLGDTDLDPLLRVTSLEKLSLGYLESLSDTKMTELLERCGKNLRELSIDSCHNLTDLFLVGIRSHCHSLRVLNLRNLADVSTEGLLSLFIVAPEEIQDDNLPHFSRSIGCLEEVNLSGIEAVTDDVVIILAQSSVGVLKRLILHSCYHITDRSLMALHKHCAGTLEWIDLSFVRKISEKALGLLVDSCPQLKTLRLYGCSQITDTFLLGYSNVGVTVHGR